MNQYEFGNKLRNLTVYTNRKHIKQNICPSLNILDVPQLTDGILITWIEEKALITGLANFPETYQAAGREFIEKTTGYVTNQKFTDLGDVNIGLFKEKPYIRWIDLQSMPDNTYNTCLSVLESL